MGKDTGIAWCDHTFNPVWGCAKVSPGCDNCYAENMGNRFGTEWGVGKPRREFGDKHWSEPLKWDSAAAKDGVRRRVFCASMADVFDKDWPDGVRGRLWTLIKATPHLDWIIVTKRIGNAAKMMPADWGVGYPNVWLLITVVNQTEMDRDWPKLRDVPAKVWGLSVEPQISKVSLPDDKIFIDWVICGAESGHHRRPFNLDWARLLRNQCRSAGVAFFLKQIPGNTKKGVVETPELDGHVWTEFPS